MHIQISLRYLFHAFISEAHQLSTTLMDDLPLILNIYQYIRIIYNSSFLYIHFFMTRFYIFLLQLRISTKFFHIKFFSIELKICKDIKIFFPHIPLFKCRVSL